MYPSNCSFGKNSHIFMYIYINIYIYIIIYKYMYIYKGISIDRESLKLALKIIMKNKNPFSKIHNYDNKNKKFSKNENENKNEKNNYQESLKSETYLHFLNREKLIIANELKISNNLQKWPCRTFQEIYDNLNTLKTYKIKNIDIDNSSLYKAKKLPFLVSNYAANCSAKYVVCTVKYDLNGG
jgi:Zn-finger nucleic acid-binding protein